MCALSRAAAAAAAGVNLCEMNIFFFRRATRRRREELSVELSGKTFGCESKATRSPPTKKI